MSFFRFSTEANAVRRKAERQATNRALCVPARAASTATMQGATGPAIPKPEAKRNAHLLSMADGMPCLLRVPNVCTADKATTVSCHSNLSIHGKAGARKADDHYTVWGCMACHSWLDQGRALAAEKESAFMAGHARQVAAWRGIATYDPFIKDRDAAQWALDQLNASSA